MEENNVRLYGGAPYTVALLHGGPGAAGEMACVAQELSGDFGVLECLQTVGSIDGQIAELRSQLIACAEGPVTLVGYSWGAWLAMLFAAEHPGLVNKTILISAGAFDTKYNGDLTKTRMERFTADQKREFDELISVPEESRGKEWLGRFGELMESADSYELVYDGSSERVEPDAGIFAHVWAEAEALRASGDLLKKAANVRCPVTAFHGDYDPHPADGVEKPLMQVLTGFRMIKLARCGHTPWKEKWAKDIFYRELKEELKNTIYVA